MCMYVMHIIYMCTLYVHVCTHATVGIYITATFDWTSHVFLGGGGLSCQKMNNHVCVLLQTYLEICGTVLLYFSAFSFDVVRNVTKPYIFNLWLAHVLGENPAYGAY